MATMCTRERYIEIVSYAVDRAGRSAASVWVKGAPSLHRAPASARPLHAVGAVRQHRPDDNKASGTSTTTTTTRTIMATITIITTPHDHGEDDASAWGHAMVPSRRILAAPGRLAARTFRHRRVGLRPCSGAILVLVFALAQGMRVAALRSTS